jgi:hypothetical protein
MRRKRTRSLVTISYLTYVIHTSMYGVYVRSWDMSASTQVPVETDEDFDLCAKNRSSSNEAVNENMIMEEQSPQGKGKVLEGQWVQDDFEKIHIVLVSRRC